MKNKPYTITTINGLKTVFYQTKGFPAVKANLLVRAGSSYEVGGNWGAFHFIEHLCFQQTKLFKDWLEVELYKEEYGLNNNASTGRERVSYWTYGPKSSLKEALTLLSELAFNTTLPEASFAKEISIITQEHQDKWDSPYNRFYKATSKQIFGSNHRYVRDGLGQPEFLKTLTHQQLTKLHQEYFTNANSILSITGDFDLDKAKEIISQLFVNQGEKVHKTPISAIKPEQKKMTHEEDVQQERPVLMWHTPGFNDLSQKQRYCLWIASYMLGGGSRSLLQKRLREELHLVYRGGSGKDLSPHAGFFELWSSNSPEQTQNAIKEMQQIVYKFIEDPIEEKLYKRSINFLKSNISLSFDSIHSISDSITGSLFWEDIIRLPDEDIKTLLDITEAEVRQTLGQYVKRENEYLSIMTSKSKTAGTVGEPGQTLPPKPEK